MRPPFGGPLPRHPRLGFPEVGGEFIDQAAPQRGREIMAHFVEDQQSCIGDQFGGVMAAGYVDQRVLFTVDDEGWCGDSANLSRAIAGRIDGS